jgi:hypothetical protein
MRFAQASRRLARLEMFSDGPCRFCAGRPHVTIRGDQPVPTCDVCGRDLPAVRIVRDPDFYHNADRLRQVADLRDKEE